MANLKTVMPQITGETRMAERRVGMPRIPLGTEGLGDAVGGAFAKTSAAVGSIMEERDELDYQRTVNEAMAEFDRRTNDEVFSLAGYSAEGASEKSLRIFREIYEKAPEKLSGRNLRRFQETFGRYGNANARRVYAFERSQLQGAAMETAGDSIKLHVRNYAVNGDNFQDPDADLNAAMESFNVRFGISHGGRTVTPERFAEFQKDMEDSDGYVILKGRRRDNGETDPDRKLLIAETPEDEEKAKEEGTPYITRVKLDTVSSVMRKISEDYQREHQNLIDSFYAARVDYLLDTAGPDAAAEYQTAVAGRTANRVSDEAFERTQSVLDVKRKRESDFRYGEQQANLFVSEYIRSAGAGDFSAGGKYLTVEMEQQALESLETMKKDAAGSTEKLEKYQAALDAWSRKKALLKENQRLAVADSRRDFWNKTGGNPEKMKEYCRQLLESPMDTAKEEFYAEAVRAAASARTPEPRREDTSGEQKEYWDRLENGLKIALSYQEKGNRRMTWNEYEYDLTDDKQFNTLLANLPKDRWARIQEYRNGSGTYARDVSEVLSDVMNLTVKDGNKYYTPGIAAYVAPRLMDAAMTVAERQIRTGGKIDKTQVREFILKQVQTSGLAGGIGAGWDGFKDNGKPKVTFDRLLKDGLPSGNARAMAEADAANRGKPAPTNSEIEAFMKRFYNLVPGEDGNYYTPERLEVFRRRKERELKEEERELEEEKRRNTRLNFSRQFQMRGVVTDGGGY